MYRWLREDVNLQRLANCAVRGVPWMVSWQCTLACNLKCKHCYSVSGKKLPDELTKEEAKKLIDDLADQGVILLIFSGGEPLLRKDLFELVQYTSTRGIVPGIGTNGTLFNDRIAKKLKASSVKYLLISLDGASAETHDKLRGVSGAFDKAIRGVKISIRAGLPVIIATTIMNSNYREIPAILKLSSKLGAVMFNTFDIIPCGRGTEIFKAEDITPQERERILNFLVKKSRERKGNTTVGRMDFTLWSRILLTHLKKEEPDDYERMLTICQAIGGCSAARWRASITPDGDVWPCSYFPVNVGNVREQSFGEIWSKSEVLSDIRDIKKIKGACQECKFRDVCRGCRSRAYAFTGDYHSEDPGCILCAGTL